MRKIVNHRNLLLASAVAGMLGATALVPAAQAEGGDQVRCYGVNKCKGVGDCSGKGHSCAGKNSCKGQGYLMIDKDTCLKIQGGRLTEDAKAEQPKS